MKTEKKFDMQIVNIRKFEKPNRNTIDILIEMIFK